MCSLLVLALYGHGQGNILDNRYSIEAKRASLYDALNIISQKTGYYFVYDSRILESDRRVRIEAKSETLERILNNLLDNPNLGYKVLSKHILIYEKGKSKPVGSRPSAPIDTASRMVVLKGTITDEQTRKPLQYVSIAVEGSSEGTVTNGEGIFVLKLPHSQDHRNIRISHIGYKPYVLPIKLVHDQMVDIYLSPSVVSLQEVVIRRVDPVEIVKAAIARRGSNYYHASCNYTTFYREGVLKNNGYLNYAEAVFKIYKPAQDHFFESNQVKEVRSRKVMNVKQTDTLLMKLKGGIATCLKLDIVNENPDFLDRNEMDRYRYTLSDILSYESHNAYAISFVQKKDVEEPLYTGTLYIDTDSLTILGAEFEINPLHISKAAEYLIVKSSRSFVVKPERFSYSINYRKVGNYYYVSHAKCDLQLKARKKGRLWGSTYRAFLEMVTCNIETKNVVKFSRQETIRPNVVFQDTPYDYDPEFWGDFSFILPEENISEALKRIDAKIEKVE